MQVATKNLAVLRRWHSASGLFPLGAYLVFHAWEHWPVREGRDELFARLAWTGSGWAELCFVIMPLLAHAALGLLLAGRATEVRPYVSSAFRRLQLVTGILAGLFLGYHGLTVWLPRIREESPLGAAYAATLEQTGQLPGVVIHVLGVGAICTHFGQGLGVALTRLFPARLPALPARVLGVLCGVMLWLVFVNELAAYATYAPLL